MCHRCPVTKDSMNSQYSYVTPPSSPASRFNYRTPEPLPSSGNSGTGQLAFDSPIPHFEIPGVLPLCEVDSSPSTAAAAPSAPRVARLRNRPQQLEQPPNEKPGSWIDWDAKARPAEELIDEFWAYQSYLEQHEPESLRCCSEVPADKACSSSGK